MLGAAIFGAEQPEPARPGRLEPELGGAAGHRVLLDPESGDIERMDHVLRAQFDHDRAADRDVQGIDFALAARDGGISTSTACRARRSPARPGGMSTSRMKSVAPQPKSTKAMTSVADVQAISSGRLRIRCAIARGRRPGAVLDRVGDDQDGQEQARARARTRSGCRTAGRRSGPRSRPLAAENGSRRRSPGPPQYHQGRAKSEAVWPRRRPAAASRSPGCIAPWSSRKPAQSR